MAPGGALIDPFHMIRPAPRPVTPFTAARSLHQ